MASNTLDKVSQRPEAQGRSFQSFAGAKIKTGNGGNAIGQYARGGNGGSVGSGNRGFTKQRYDDSDLTTGAGGMSSSRKGPGARGPCRKPMRAAIAGHGGSIGSANTTVGLQQEFFQAEIETGDGGDATSALAEGGQGGGIGSHNA